MATLHRRAAVEVGYRTGYFQYSVVSSCREVHSLHSHSEQVLPIFVERYILLYHLRRHLSVTVYFGEVFEASLLYCSRFHDAFAYGSTTLGTAYLCQLLERYGHYLYVHIYSVEQRSRDTAQIALHHRRSAYALLVGVVVVSTRTRVHRGNKHKACRIFGSKPCPRDRYLTVFEGLTHHLEHGSLKFG